MDELCAIARRLLLDALEALHEHCDAMFLVGAQAIYLHTGAAELGVAEYTTDADLALDPSRLGEIPPLEQALEGAGFYGPTRAVGVWETRRRNSEALDIDVQVDLLVPATVSPGSGRRAARLPDHSVTAARKVDGLEECSSTRPSTTSRHSSLTPTGASSARRSRDLVPYSSPRCSSSTSAAAPLGRTTRTRSTCCASSRLKSRPGDAPRIPQGIRRSRRRRMDFVWYQTSKGRPWERR